MGQDTSKKDTTTDHTVNYLDAKVNIFAPSTPFMREHLRIIWMMFAAWLIVVFGPVTTTFFIPDIMNSITFLGFPLHYFLTAIGGPLGALILSFIYARKRDQLDVKYDIHHSPDQTSKAETTSTEKEIE